MQTLPEDFGSARLFFGGCSLAAAGFFLTAMLAVHLVQDRLHFFFLPGAIFCFSLGHHINPGYCLSISFAFHMARNSWRSFVPTPSAYPSLAWSKISSMGFVFKG